MTIHDKRRFAQAFNRLVIATRLPANQVDAAMQQVYFEGLVELPIEAIEDGAKALEDRDWFPKLGEWKTAADAAKTQRVIQAGLPPAGRAWQDECATCADSGFEFLECDGPEGPRRCEHCRNTRLPKYPHAYTVPCACRPTNHTYQRRVAEVHARARSRAEASEARS